MPWTWLPIGYSLRCSLTKMAATPPRKPILSRSEEILGGIPVFSGTRVPVQALIDCLEAGDRIDEFLEDFPTVTREQAVAVLEMAREALIRDAGPSG
jgi:uncharacterized protein (DUF433 family)